MGAKHAKKSKYGKLYITGIIAAILMIVGILAASVSALVLNVLPLKLSIPCIAGALIICAVIAFFLFRSKSGKAGRSVCIALAILLTVVSAFATYYCIVTAQFLDSSDDVSADVIEYSVIAKKDSGIKLSPQVSLVTGEWSGDPVMINAEQELLKYTKPEFVQFNSSHDLVLATEGLPEQVDPAAPEPEDIAEKVEIGVIQSSFLENIASADDTLYDRIEVIMVFSVSITQINPIDEIQDPDKDPNAPFILYISGIDTFGKISTVSRSDVNMLAVVNPRVHKILLLNTPRDTYVQLHGTTGLKDKLTHAGNFGVKMSIDTLEDLYDITIDKYVRINFTSFIDIINAIGGVDVDSAYAFSDKGQSYTKGINHLTGDRALTFARARHPFAAGDFVRGENQQRVIEAVIKKLTNPSVLTKYTKILSSLKGKIQTNVGNDELKNLINNQLQNNDSWKVERFGLIGKGTKQLTYSISKLKSYVMIVDEESLAEAKEKISALLAEGAEDVEGAPDAGDAAGN